MSNSISCYPGEEIRIVMSLQMAKCCVGGSQQNEDDCQKFHKLKYSNPQRSVAKCAELIL